MADEQAMPKKVQRGFALMSPQKRRAIARMGGKASHALGRAHKWDYQAASDAGKKGGKISSERRKEKQ